MISAEIHIFLISYTQSFEIELDFSLSFYFSEYQQRSCKVKTRDCDIREFARTRECQIGVFDTCLDDIKFFSFFCLRFSRMMKISRCLIKGY